MAPNRCVVDTNVLVAPGTQDETCSASCRAECARALQAVMLDGRLFVDAGRLIVREYQRNVRTAGQTHAGVAFLKWVLTHEWNADRVTRVAITPKDGATDDFCEVPPATGAMFDPSDRKFLAVAAGHPDKPAILEATDSKWWGWRDALAAAGVSVHFLCEEEIASKYREKMGE